MGKESGMHTKETQPPPPFVSFSSPPARSTLSPVKSPEQRITAVSIAVNALLTALKLAVGLLGRSHALVADAAHSLSDFATDFAVLAGLHFARKPQDDDHRYGHGKYETLATVAIGIVLAWGAVGIAWDALSAILRAVRGTAPAAGPSALVFWTAVASVLAKGWLYRATMATARATGSPALVANAWHHRSDALSSVAVAAGTGASVFFGNQWAVLDPVAALFVAVLLARVAWQLLSEQLGVLTDKSLAQPLCDEILDMARGVEGVTDPHKLRTRMVGRYPVIDLHIRLPADMSLDRAHRIATDLEHLYVARFGPETLVNLHLEPSRTPAP